MERKSRKDQAGKSHSHPRMERESRKDGYKKRPRSSTASPTPGYKLTSKGYQCRVSRCPKQDKVFNEIDDLKFHWKIWHTKVKLLGFQCTEPFCKITSDTLKDARTHLRNSHGCSWESAGQKWFPREKAENPTYVSPRSQTGPHETIIEDPGLDCSDEEMPTPPPLKRRREERSNSSITSRCSSSSSSSSSDSSHSSSNSTISYHSNRSPTKDPAEGSQSPSESLKDQAGKSQKDQAGKSQEDQVVKSQHMSPKRPGAGGDAPPRPIPLEPTSPTVRRLKDRLLDIRRSRRSLLKEEEDVINKIGLAEAARWRSLYEQEQKRHVEARATNAKLLQARAEIHRLAAAMNWD